MLGVGESRSPVPSSVNYFVRYAVVAGSDAVLHKLNRRATIGLHIPSYSLREEYAGALGIPYYPSGG